MSLYDIDRTIILCEHFYYYIYFLHRYGYGNWTIGFNAIVGTIYPFRLFVFLLACSSMGALCKFEKTFLHTCKFNKSKKSYQMTFKAGILSLIEK